MRTGIIRPKIQSLVWFHFELILILESPNNEKVFYRRESRAFQKREIGRPARQPRALIQVLLPMAFPGSSLLSDR